MGIQSCELDGASIVLTGGTFNPPIFQPAWMAANGLLPAGEAEAVQLEVVHPEVAVFSLDWLRVQVTRDKFQVETSDPAQAVTLRDLVLGIFDLLEHTPFTRMGLNRHMHFKLDRIEDWEEIARPLAPSEPWGDVLGDHPVPANVSFSGTRPGPAKRLKAAVQLSNRIQPGVYVGTNEHYESEATGQDGAKELLAHLAACWEASQRHARVVAERVLGFKAP